MKELAYRPFLSWVAPLVYLLLGVLLLLQNPGLEYDEALMAHGSVQMLKFGHEEPRFPHDRGSWIPLGGRWWPLMVIPYVGAGKHYLLLLPFALFGPHAWLIRFVSVLLAAFGIFGISIFLRQQAGPGIALVTTLALAIHPAYLDLTVFDNSGTALWMGTLGLLLIIVSKYTANPTLKWAFLVGFGAGLGVWARLNFLWFLGAVGAAALLVYFHAVRNHLRHFPALLLGTLVGSAPVVVYELLSGFATLKFMKTFSLKQSLWTVLPRRLFLAAEILVSDSERRVMWGGPSVPGWQIIFLVGVVGLACLACVGRFERKEPRQRLSLAIVMAFLFYLVILCSSRQNIRQHHFFTALPLAAAVVVLGTYHLGTRWRLARFAVLGGGLLYVAIALHWNVAAIRGLGRTRGLDDWSASVFNLAEDLKRHAAGKQVVLLDWGFGNSLFVISNGEIRPRELFWGATEDGTAFNQRWSDILAQGGVFITGGERSLRGAFRAATVGFKRALADGAVSFSKHQYMDGGGHIYAEVYYVVRDGALSGLSTEQICVQQDRQTPLSEGKP